MTDPIVVDAVLLAELKGYLNAIGVDQQLWPKEIKAAYNVGMSPRVVLALIARIEEQGKLLGDSHHQLTMAVLGGFDTEEAHRLLDRIAEADHD